MRNSRIMVCGGAGFIGSHLVDRLIEDGHEVDVVDNLDTGSLSNLAGARSATGRFKFQNVAVDSPEFAELVSLRRPEIIFNLVSLSPAMCHLSGGLSSVKIATTILEASRLAAVTKVISVLPSSLLYGEVAAKDIPIKEGHFTEPRTAEEVFARAISDLHMVYRDRHGVEFTVLAVANAYGRRQRAGDGVVASFVDALESGKAPVIHGTGKQTRDFVHVDDVVDACVRTLDRAGGLVVNIGSGVSTSVKELWSLMAGASALTPRTAASRPHDIARLALSPVRARIQLGWSPYTSLKDGLAGLRGS
ncbi:MAG: UDP-glucose 4-epimerase [Actinomycetota bacterium]|jgi:UDP-glucose 4-epimerase